MENEEMINEENVINDKLDSYKATDTSIHITLKQLDPRTGKHCWLNGKLKEKITPKVWLLDEDKLGVIRVSISEIIPNGVEERK